MSRLPNCRPREVVAALKQAGFVEHHQTGSHLYLFHAEKRLMVCVPIHPGDLKRWVLKAIIKQSGLTDDDFRKLL